jgi:hypothetical protein
MEEPTASTYVDRFGFVCDRQPAQDVLKENARLEKWREMLTRWAYFQHQKQKLVKDRVRKGIPDALRSVVWCELTKVDDLKSRYPNDIYLALSQRDDVCVNQDIIEVDLNRTFPKNRMFMEESGRATLRRVLRAYSFLDDEVGYCQGMAFLAAVLLTYLEEEKAFWVFVCLLRNYNLKLIFAPGMPDLHRQLFIAGRLLAKFMPETAASLKGANMDISFIATPWFMTLYSNSLPFGCVVRVWDCFVYEGNKVIYRVFLAMFKLMKKRLKKLDFEKKAELIKETSRTADPDLLMKTAFEFNLSRSLLERLSSEYDATLT